MSQSINTKLSEIKLPPNCVVCLSPAAKQHELQKTFKMGRRSYTVKINVPMCDVHAEAAGFKSPAERFMEKLAVFGGIIGGLIAAILLVVRWVDNVSIIAKIFGGALFGLGAFIIIWWITTDSIAPFFASQHSKEARNAIRIGMYWPREGIVRLDFDNDQLAEMIKNSN